MANKKAEKKKGLIAGICIAVVVIAVAIIAVVVVNLNKGLNDSYFVSDGTKYVLTIDTDETLLTDESQPIKTHLVYTYSGDEITGLKTYSVYKDSEAAQKAYKTFAEMGENMTNFTVDGKYLIMTATADQYNGITASDVKAQIEYFESLKKMNMENSTTNNGTTVEAGGEVTVEETQK